MIQCIPLSFLPFLQSFVTTNDIYSVYKFMVEVTIA